MCVGFRSSPHSVRFGQLLRCAHKRIVNIMKVYIEGNNIQVELYVSVKIATLLTLEILKWEYTFATDVFTKLGSLLIWKRKGDVHDPGKYRGITLLSQVLKLLERVLDARIRRRVEGDFGEEQQGFRKGRGTADGMYVLRQMVEKRLEVQGSMALGFVDLEKAFDTVPREMVMATLRWMGVPEAEVRMVEGTYEKTTARVVVGEGASEEFEVKIGLRQSSVLSPLLFIAVLDLISSKTVVKDDMKKLLYGDDLALVANGKQELQETMEEWNGLFTKHGLKLNLEKTEVLHIGHQREELDIELEGNKLTQRDSFVYLGGAVCGDGKTEREVRRRVQAGANAWRSVEGVMADRRISNRLKGKVVSTCVTPACLYGTETLALTELQQQRRQVCENKLGPKNSKSN